MSVPGACILTSEENNQVSLNKIKFNFCYLRREESSSEHHQLLFRFSKDAYGNLNRPTFLSATQRGSFD